MERISLWGYCALLMGVLTGCANSPGHGSVSPGSGGVAAGTSSGFRVFKGDCLNTQASNLNPLLVPLLTNVVSGGLKVIGTGLKKYGEDSDARFASTLNFDKGEDLNGCLHVVYGSVFTDSADFLDSAVKLEDILPLPWLAVARANGSQGEPAQKAIARLPNVIASAKHSLVTSGAMLAEKPSFFAELKAVRSPDGSKVAFRLRAFYYGERLAKGWLPRSSSKAVVLTVAGFDASKALLDNLKSGFSVVQSDVPVGQAWVNADLLYPNGAGEGRNAWDSPWFTLPADKTTPFTVVAGLLETTAGSKLLGVLGAALEGSADTTAKNLVDSLDSSKRAVAEDAARVADNTARANAASAVVKAIADVGLAKDAHDACISTMALKPAASAKVQRDAILAFASARVTAAASISAAEPLFSQMGIPVTFIDQPGDCVVSQ